VFIAVGTPSRRGDGHADLTYVFAARGGVGARSTAAVIVTKSTVPVGTGDEVERIIAETGPDKGHFTVVSNPEFLREGAAIGDFKRPDRIVIGARTSFGRAR
jgi:UDPglucose 6-dehydrogenase